MRLRSSVRLDALASVVACVLPVVACDAPGGAPSQCLPVVGAVMRVDDQDRVGTPRGEEDAQGTSLQGGRPRDDEEGQGTSLQGGRPRDDEDLQGTSLQGGRPRDDEDPQGTSLQGGRPRDDEDGQGTSLQGGRPRDEEDPQGTSLQGGRPRDPRDEEDPQGTNLQGGRPRDEEETQGSSYQGRRIGLEAMVGMRIELTDGSPVVLQDGRLVAGARVGAAALQGQDLRGIAKSGQRFALRIATVEAHGGGERIVLEADGSPVCGDDGPGIFVAGAWDEYGSFTADEGELTFSCTDGVISKCIDWGYAPWSFGAEVHQSCTRLARADYCGDGRPWTLDGTHIDVYDDFGVQQRVGFDEMSFEAAWGEQGAVCVNATRYDIEDEDGWAIVPDCFASLPRCTSLADATMAGAVLANDSRHTRIEACAGG
ncbi:MAG: hypothetical protein IPK74_37025 [Deltaproteobacteria bacterium]|nr:hypothetical protein [Deltaproteobacteria bacterium]